MSDYVFLERMYVMNRFINRKKEWEYDGFRMDFIGKRVTSAGV